MGRKQIDPQLFCHRDTAEPGYRILDQQFTAYGVTVPEGFKWNGASTPLVFRWMVPKFDHSLISSCIHDYLCSIAKDENDRLVADRLYKRLLIEVEGFSEFRAKLAYRGVRIGAYYGVGVHY